MDNPELARADIERFRAGVLRLYVNIALVVLGPLVVMYLYMGMPGLAVGAAILLVCTAGLHLVLRRMPTARVTAAARVFVALILLLVVYAHYAGDELLDNKPWLVVVPILTMSLLGPVEGLVWVTAAVAGVGIAYGVVPGRYEPFAILIQLASTGTAAYVFYRFMLHNERNVAAISRLSNIDPLTGSYNRRSFSDSFEREFQRNRRNAGSLTVMMIDIDHFKEYNDHYGHQCGDRALTRIAASLADTVKRASDQVYRYGGEEFCVLLSGVAHDDALRLAEHMRERVHALGIVHSDAPEACLTISVGVCHSDALALTDADAMLHSADKALYAAKAHGRNRVEDAHCQAVAA